MAEELVAGDGFAIDASVVHATANCARGVPGKEVVEWKANEVSSRAVRCLPDRPRKADAGHSA